MTSYKEINFRLRPAKSMERKMMVDIFQKLAHIKPLREYRYVGFGSTFFSEFRLFHKRLGIEDMVSIEQVWNDEERFRYNRPFSCIDLMIEKSTEALPTLDWEKPTILWLDYDSNLQQYMLEDDLQQFFVNAVPGSVIFITVNARSHADDSFDEEESRLDRLKEEVGQGNVPSDVELEKIWLDKPGVYRNIITEVINYDYLRPRNSGVPEEEQVHFQQLANFVYEDDAKMMTIGGILLNDQIQDSFEKANFQNLEFVRMGEDQYNIPTPNLTFEEMRGLDQHLPGPINENDDEYDVPVPEDKREEYAEVYRYFPRFVESEL